MVQQLKELVTKSSDLGLIPGANMVEGVNQLLELSSDLHTCYLACYQAQSSSLKRSCTSLLYGP